jgi:signal transduction histidine kinase
MIRRITFLESSSTKLAVIFTALLAMAAVLLGFGMYAMSNGETMHPLYPNIALVLMLIVSGLAFFISFHVTKRINRIVGTADRIIATTDLSQRIPLGSRWDDLAKLSETLNAMLAEIEQLVFGIRTLSDNIAHDLRHPLTRMRNHMETIRDQAAPEAQAPLNELIAECDGLLTTFQALLRISNIESGKRHAGFVAIDMAQLLHDVAELYEPLAAEKSIRFILNPVTAQVVGDKDLLFQAFANLIDNAIKYTPEQGQIDIDMQPQERGARVIIRDTGLGVSDEHKQRVFRRFYRVEHSRRAPGSGLGLSLVAAIIKLHQGMIQLHDNQPAGLIVTVTL